MRGGKTCLTLVAAPEPRSPSERSWASLPSGPWVRWPVGTSPNWPRWQAAPHPGRGPAAHPAPARLSPHQPVLGGLPDPADVVHVLLLHSRIHCRERGKGVTGTGSPCPTVGGGTDPPSRRLQGRGTCLCPQTDPQMAWSGCDTETQRGLDTGERSRWTQGQLRGGRTPSTGTSRGCAPCPRGQAGDLVSRLPSTARQVSVGASGGHPCASISNQQPHLHQQWPPPALTWPADP